MLFTREFKEAIRAGRVTRTYRDWKRPQARVGGRYNLHPDGIIEVDAIAAVNVADVGDRDAERAGFSSGRALRTFLKKTTGTVYQVDFRYAGAGLVGAPETDRVEPNGLGGIQARLDRMDGRSDRPWTREALRLIAACPGTRAADLALQLGWETPRFKAQIRKLKALGLTISLEVGYRLSPRGAQVLEAAKPRGGA